jgi:hypothetical protein
LIRIYKTFLILFVSFFLISSGCTKKSDNTDNKTQQNKSGEFGWKDGISASDIPDFPVKGNLEGREVQFQYINFEKWRGSGDNVINFSLVKPAQNCGFIEGYSGFTFMSKGAAINPGETVKAKFVDDPKTLQAYFQQGDMKSSALWNSALIIESMTDKVVKGKIAVFFNDEKKSWVAGKFEAVICNN